MASKRLLDKRREVEAAEKLGKTTTTKKKATRKKATSTTTRKRKTKAPERKRLLWGVFSGTLKEEGRYLWNEKDKAEERLAQLRAKSKKLFFIQPIKESLSESGKPLDEQAPSDEDDDSLNDEAMMDDEDDIEDVDDDGEEE
ncbi:MAG: hypothetical protein KDA80_11240 [Planctomycetaceae bacterium]|nr:hypothetical protein [Planctomycetaceae bacterium]